MTPYLVRCAGRQAIVTLPGQIDVPDTGQVGGELLPVISRGAAALIADMTARVSRGTAGSWARAMRVSMPVGRPARAGRGSILSSRRCAVR